MQWPTAHGADGLSGTVSRGAQAPARSPPQRNTSQIPTRVGQHVRASATRAWHQCCVLGAQARVNRPGNTSGIAQFDTRSLTHAGHVQRQSAHSTKAVVLVHRQA